MKDIILLQQTADTVTLYANCVKKGYTTICYFQDPESICTIQSEDPVITLRDLDSGDYYIYAENKEQHETGHTSFTVSALPKKTLFQNIALSNHVTIDNTILASLSAENYILDLYKKLIQENTVTEEALLAFIEFYNAQQETLNTNDPEFIIENQTITVRTKIPYRFIPYVYHIDTDSWQILREQADNNTEVFSFYGKPALLYRICVLSDFSVVRDYFLYQPSETLSETILERQIQTKKNRAEKLAEQILQINLEEIADDENGQKTVASLLQFAPDHVIFRKPEINIEDMELSCHIPDYSCIELLDKPIFLCILELEETFAKVFRPHRYKINEQDFIIPPFFLSMNPDTEYVLYLSDESGKILTEPILISLNPEYPTELYTVSYYRTIYDTYIRKLNSVFKEYGKEQWNQVAKLLEQYLLQNDYRFSIPEFLCKQLIRLNPDRERIDRMLELVILCQLRYYANIDQSFISHQVYSKEFKSHVFPEAEHPYIVRTIRFNDGEITYDYFLTGEESLSIRMDKDAYLLLQCIDPDTWTVSAPAFYNNRVRSGAPYFYFPKLEVEVI